MIYGLPRAAECGGQQYLGASSIHNQYPAVLPCSAPNLFSLEIPHKGFEVFKIQQPIQNWHWITWTFHKPVAGGQESVISPASTLPVDAVCAQRKEGILALAIHTSTLHPLYPQHSAFCTSMQQLLQVSKNRIFCHLYLLSLPSAWLSHGWMWALKNTLTTTQLCIGITTEHTQSVLHLSVHSSPAIQWAC